MTGKSPKKTFSKESHNNPKKTQTLNKKQPKTTPKNQQKHTPHPPKMGATPLSRLLFQRQVLVPPREARSFEVPKGHLFRISSVEGPQVRRGDCLGGGGASGAVFFLRKGCIEIVGYEAVIVNLTFVDDI